MNSGFRRVPDPQPCVTCEACCFTFHADHSDHKGDYTCPNCAEDRLAADLKEAREVKELALARIKELEGEIRYLKRVLECVESATRGER